MNNMMFGGGDIMFTIIPIIIAIGGVLILGMIIATIVGGIIQWNKNNNSPILTIEARVVAKRMEVSHRSGTHNNEGMSSHSSSSTTYYATFEAETKSRIELKVPDNEYGMLVEGDMGRLTFQGTRYKGFERTS